MLAPSTHQQNAVIDCRSPRTRGQRANQSSQIDSLAARSARWSSDAACRTAAVGADVEAHRRWSGRRARPAMPCRRASSTRPRSRLARAPTDRERSWPAKLIVAAPPPNSITCGSTRVIGSASPVASRTTSVSSTRHSASERSYSEVCTRTPSPSRNTSRRERGRVNGACTRSRCSPASAARAAASGVSIRRCAPPRPAAAGLATLIARRGPTRPCCSGFDAGRSRRRSASGSSPRRMPPSRARS